MKPALSCLLLTSLFYVGQSYADCTVQSTAVVTQITIDMHRVVVSANAKVGDIIAQQTWPISKTPTLYYCTSGSIIDNGINTSLLTNSSTKIHPTNIQGVGMQISRSDTSGAQQNVYLESVNYSELKAVGSTATDTDFTIQLKCTGGATTNVGYDNVELTFSGTTPSSLTNNDGVLVNEVESTGAKGVGIQVLDNTKTPLKLDSKYTVGSLTGAESGYNINTNYTARYYRYGSTISAGPVESKMVFAITYD